MASTSTRALPAASHRSRLIRHSARLLPHATSRAAAAGRFPDPGAIVMVVAAVVVVVVVAVAVAVAVAVVVVVVVVVMVEMLNC
jgi:hypothetical protein